MTGTSVYRIIHPVAFSRGATVSNRSGRNHLRARSGRSAARVVLILLLSFFVILRTRQRRPTPSADESAPPPVDHDAGRRQVRSGRRRRARRRRRHHGRQLRLDARQGRRRQPPEVPVSPAKRSRRCSPSTDSFAASQPGFPIKVGLYYFSSGVHPARAGPNLRRRGACARRSNPCPRPTAARRSARRWMSPATRSTSPASIRKYILVVTDGENTDGRDRRAKSLRKSRAQ